MKSSKRKKQLLSVLSASVATSAIVSVAPAGFAAQGTVFSDVKSSDHFYEAVRSLHARNVINGFKDGTFRPYEKLTRAQAAKIVAAALNLDIINVQNPKFKDVPQTSWEYRYVAALANKGIINGSGGRFKPADPLTRAQLAQILGAAYQLEKTPLKDLRFIDVKPNDWFAGYVQPLIEKGITQGTTSTTFSPNQLVNRGQMASFIYRSELAMKQTQINSAIKNITDQEIVTEKGSYKIPNHIKTWVNPSNLASLKGAVINFQVNNGTVQKVNTIELNTSGKAGIGTNAENDGHVVLDAREAIIDANVVVNGDYVTIKNATIKGDLHIGKGVENSFYTDNMKVEGNTAVSETVKLVKQSSSTIYKSLAFKMSMNGQNVARASAVGKAKVNFHNSKLRNVEVSTNGIVLETTGSSTVESLSLLSDATFTAADSVTIPKLVIQSGVQNVVIEANVQEIAIVGNENVTISGSGNFERIIANASTVSFQTSGRVGTLGSADKVSKFILGLNMKVQNLELPDGAKPEDVIKNFESVKGNIEQINGQKVPGAAPSMGGGSSAGGGGGVAISPVPTIATPPFLTADSTEPKVEHNIELTFTDNSAWRSNITTVEVDRAALASNKYTVESGKITLDSSVFPAAKNYAIVIKATGFSNASIIQTILAADQVAQDAPALSATASAGSVVGSTKISATPENGNTLGVLVSSSPIETPKAGADIPEGITKPYISGSDIQGVDATEKKYVALYEVDSENKIVKFKLMSLTAEQIKADDSVVPDAAVLTATASSGTAAGSTRITATPENGNKLAVLVSSTSIETPKAGAEVPPGTMNPYISGNDIQGADAAAKKYVAVYELDSENKVVNFKLITLTASQIKSADEVADPLTGGSLADKTGAGTNGQVVVTLPAAAAGNSFAYRVFDAAQTAPNLDTVITLGEGNYTAIEDKGTINAAAGKHVVIVEIDSTGKVKKFVDLVSNAVDDVLTAPAELAAESGDRVISLTWSAAPGATGYDIYQAETENGTFAKLGSTVASTTLNVTNLAYAEDYYYYIKPVAGNEVGPASTTIKVVTNVDQQGPQYKADFVVISNESVDTVMPQSSGTLVALQQFTTKSNTIPGYLDVEAYRYNPVKLLNRELINNAPQNDLKFSMQSTNVLNSIKSFKVYNEEMGRYESTDAQLLYSGTYGEVWVQTGVLTAEQAQAIGKEFDEGIYPTITSKFGTPSDVDNDGRVAILCLDIQDGWNGSGGYIGGYFDGNDLLNGTNSNNMELFYVDTYPTMGTDKNNLDVSKAYSTLAHEFQHMVNFNQNWFQENKGQMDTWLDEGLAMAAEHAYSGVQNNRISYYNASTSIQNGHSLLNWTNRSDVLSNYSLSYLFVQYLKTQAGQGDAIFKEIIDHPENNYKAVESVIKKYIDPTMSFGEFMTAFRMALVLKADTGLYGFHGDQGFNQLAPRLFTGSSTELLGGEAVVIRTENGSLTDQGNKGTGVTYTGVTEAKTN
ncbi:hypothetical protein CVD28_09035 [Bacillus sp. M6-12]|uniref:S-layer homology domain-containing protein n=1 Tax=Bacillus sp. M6-12 TaxID=2054166 RepID=UPI000C77314E|nr:S-layer homology domain-containing protein [Bacillus sp. M6-12]PLS17834.1 hypothetical protein CVD28_09035 [Bacillus sp. M6-12]